MEPHLRVRLLTNPTFYRPDLQQSRIQLGSSFTLAEGGKTIAVGTITEILDQTMNNPMPKKGSVIFVDVDDTLIRSFGTKQIPIPNTIQYVREMFTAGNILYCWSRGGAQYSHDVATKLGIADCFVCFLPKPDVVVDDRLEQLLDHCEFIHPNNAVTQPMRRINLWTEAVDRPIPNGTSNLNSLDHQVRSSTEEQLNFEFQASDSVPQHES